MSVETHTIELSTRGNTDIQDITRNVLELVGNAEINNGTVIIFSPSSTSGLTTIEYEAGCLSDLRRLFDEIVNPNRNYAHNARWHDGNGHSHVRAALLGASISIPIVSRRLTLGTWQQIIFIDFDVRPRNRELVVQIIGE